jgi:hypothetical protein
VCCPSQEPRCCPLTKVRPPISLTATSTPFGPWPTVLCSPQVQSYRAFHTQPLGCQVLAYTGEGSRQLGCTVSFRALLGSPLLHICSLPSHSHSLLGKREAFHPSSCLKQSSGEEGNLSPPENSGFRGQGPPGYSGS